ncbi:HIT family protein [Pelagibaculum spongiae]|uniref:HIT family protein n=1 Tax=Pelagibaculum spongiae TaxID=2080658 RepID=A0A2V1GWA6_9GAMM|nr:HIT domain-containing protein [Pelagibaculum spongiae]PVZ70618.1 HIT family protein [Pelagibaculum spongiae]
MAFQLHPQLAADTVKLGDFPLCSVLLAKDALYPWCILVPRRDEIREIHRLSEADQQQLLKESSLLAATMEQLFSAEKMNIAALGNMVPQLHLHHVARFSNDLAWPSPIWGRFAAQAYSEAALAERVSQLKQTLNEYFVA